MLDQWLEQCGVSFRKASLIQDKKTREGPDCLPVCSFIKRGLTETSQLGLFFHPTQWRATLFAKVSAPGARLRSQSLWTKWEKRKKEGVEKGKKSDRTWLDEETVGTARKKWYRWIFYGGGYQSAPPHTHLLIKCWKLIIYHFLLSSIYVLRE